MVQPDAFSISLTGAFYGTSVVDAMPGFMEAITSHELSSGTDRDAILIDFIRIASGRRICPRPGIQSNDGCDVIFHDIFIDTNGVMTTVIDSVLNLPV
jgi:alpha-D-ribose 1-methylphosphonate 5-triphosphate diphosphatase PhnM